MEIKTILVVVAPNVVNEQILQKAEKLAARYDASLYLLMVCSDNANLSTFMPDNMANQNISEYLIKSHSKQIKHYLTRLHNQGIAAQGEAVSMKPLYTAILKKAEDVGANLIVKQTHHHSALSRAFITNTDWHLIRESHIPLLLVKDQEWGSHFSVAAAVDPVHTEPKHTVLDVDILQTTHDLACHLPAEMHVVHACLPIPTGIFLEFDAIAGDYSDYRNKVHQHHQQALDALLRDRVENNIEVHFEEGEPEKILPEVVRDSGIDILVMGAISRSGWDKVFIGSTAERVLDNLHCDIWIVK